MSATLLGRIDWFFERDKDSNRTYTIKWLVKTSDTEDGPLTVYTCPSIPGVGTPWAYGNDSDPWAFCIPEAKVTQLHNTQDPQNLWIVEQHFSTRPLNRCQNDQIENPLLEPIGLSGSFVKYTRERHYDRFGNPVRTSAGELMKGSTTEVDESRPSVIVKMNTSTNQLANYAPMMDTVNDAPLWGCPARCVKLSGASWERKLYGTCTYYYTTTLEFNINFATFDRNLYDYGSWCILPDYWKNSDGTLKSLTNTQKDALVLQGKIGRYTDRDGKESEVFLDGHGVPWHTHNPGPNDTPPYRHTEYYGQSNFLLLGIPSSL